MPDRQVEKKLRHAQQYGSGSSSFLAWVLAIKALFKSPFLAPAPPIDHDPEGDTP